MSAQCIGTAPASVRHFVRSRWGETAWAKILADVGAEHRRDVAEALPYAWYPVDLLDAVFLGIAKHACHGDPASYESTFRSVGAQMAADNFGTLHKVMLALVKPDHLLGLLARLWMTSFNGIEVLTERRDPKVKAGLCIVRGLPISFLGPVACGWLEHVYRQVGCKNPRATNREFSRAIIGAEVQTFDLDWT